MPALLTEVRGQVAYLTLNRPQVRNALNPEDEWDRSRRATARIVARRWLG